MSIDVQPFPDDESVMQLALELARKGIGSVEPNPPVGAVLVDAHRRLLATGYHQQFGGPHAEVHALRAAGPSARGATLFVTLEPCCHTGKTPPCAQAIIDAQVERVIVATVDPAEYVSGQGIEQLRHAGIPVDVGLCQGDAQRLIAPFTKLTTTGLPYVHAKWAMTIDGKIACRTGASKWITSEASRTIVHQLRGRMDAIVTGIGTVLADDPLLTARPPGPRTPWRVVVDSQARLPIDSQLVATAKECPVLEVTTTAAPAEPTSTLTEHGVEHLSLPPDPTGRVPLDELFAELGRRRMTNVLLEAGGELLGACLDAGLIDEVHCFIAPKIVGGKAAPSPIGGRGVAKMSSALEIDRPHIELLDGDVYIHGPLHNPVAASFTRAQQRH